jgi:hypothetical protein
MNLSMRRVLLALVACAVGVAAAGKAKNGAVTIDRRFRYVVSDDVLKLKYTVNPDKKVLEFEGSMKCGVDDWVSIGLMIPDSDAHIDQMVVGPTPKLNSAVTLIVQPGDGVTLETTREYKETKSKWMITSVLEKDGVRTFTGTRALDGT